MLARWGARAYTGNTPRTSTARGQNLLQIINDILDMSKIDAGKLELREDSSRSARRCCTCIRMIGGRAHEAGVLIVNDLPTDLPRLHADQVRFKQILLNLMSNAVKFTPRRGSVRLSAERARGRVAVAGQSPTRASA